LNAKRIATRGYFGSAKAIATAGYFGGVSFDDTAVVSGSVFGPSASGLVYCANVDGVSAAPLLYGTATGPQTSSVVEGQGETWH
jgi:hypothetical protein